MIKMQREKKKLRKYTRALNFLPQEKADISVIPQANKYNKRIFTKQNRTGSKIVFCTHLALKNSARKQMLQVITRKEFNDVVPLFVPQVSRRGMCAPE